MTSLQEQIKQKEAELAELKLRIEQEQKLSDDEKLAIQLHDILCTWNHTDGCSWHYELNNNVHDWNGHAHKEYLRKAVKLRNALEPLIISTKDALQIFKIVKKL